MPTFLSLLVGAFVCYIAIIGLMYVGQRSLMYVPPRTPPPSPAEAGVPEFDIVSYKTEDGLNLAGWHHPAKPGHPTILYFQGNAGHTADRAYKAPKWVNEGFGVFFAGYRGYSGNPGKPSETGLALDADAAVVFLAKKNAPPNHLILYGESLGTGVSSDLAYRLAQEQTPVAGLILESPFTSMANAAQSHYPWLPARYLVKDRFETLDKISKIKAPLLVLHGDADRIVPFSHGKTVFTAALEPKQAEWVEGGGHSDLYDFGAAGVVGEFLDSLK